MGRIGSHRSNANSSAPNISKAGSSTPPSPPPVSSSSTPVPQQDAQQLSEQQKSQRKLDKKVSGEMKQAVFRGKTTAGAQRTAPTSSPSSKPTVPGSDAPKLQSSSSQPGSPQMSPRKLEKKFSGEMKQAIYRGQTKVGAYYKASPETHAQLQKVSGEVNSELAALYKKYPTFTAEGKRSVSDPADKEKLGLYENLANSLKSPEKSNAIGQAIAENKDHPLYKQWGATKFSAFVALSNSNLEKSKVSTHGMTTMQRAALLGYTTGDYDLINPALRQGKGKIADTYLSAYTKEVKGALKNIPDYQAPSGQPSQVYRAIYPSKDPTKNNDWCKTAFVKGNTYSDFAFSSTAAKAPPAGDWNLTIVGTKNAKDIAPFSAWPGEVEALVIPGQAYTVHDVQGRNVTLIPQ